MAFRGFKGSDMSELGVLFEQLREAQLHLDGATRKLERQFLATSTQLESLAQCGEEFVKQIENLVRLATGQDGDHSVFAEAIQLVEQATQFLAGCRVQTGRMLEELKEYSGQIEHLLGFEAELQRTMLPLTFVQTLFKAESAPLGPGVQQMFTALTREIEALHARVREIFGTKFKQLEQTRATIGKVIGQLERQAQTLQEVTTTQKAQIESSIEALKKELFSNQERDVRLHRLSKDFSREVGQTVVSLQFQDIVNQKIQHIREALPRIEAKYAELIGVANPGARIEQLRFLNQSCRIEAEQLQAARGDLSGAEGTIQASINRMLSRLAEVDSRSLSLEEFKLLTTSFDGMVQVLVETIEEVRNLVTATAAGAAEAYELLRPLGSLASDLTGIVRGVSAQIKLIGLNAQVQAARAALDRRGAGLEVLSARTSEISSETARISQEAAGRLDQLAAGLAGCVKAFGELRANGLAQQGILSERGGAEEERLHAFRDRALETLRAIGDSLDGIRARALQTLESAHFTEFLEETLPALLTPLAGIAAEADRLLGSHGVSTDQSCFVGDFRRHYTMHSEREVFDGVVEGAGTRAAGGSSDAAALDFEPRTVFPDGVEGGEAGAQEEERHAGAETGGATAGAGDLGANVELF
jgi:hypothetical protein